MGSGTRFGKYTLLRKIATGGMAEVFLARSEGVGGFQKLLVIKRILPNLAEDQQFVSMFLNEARVASQLNHPSVVSIYELGEVDSAYYIAMEHIDGPNLRSLCRRATDGKTPIPLGYAVKMISLACEGLHYAHEAVGLDGSPLNIIHRDISPDNILLSRQGVVKVVDFGIAKAANQPHLTKSGILKGKIAYMPPEQIRGHSVDRRSDVFALGVCLYELLAGSRPFDSTSEVAMMQAILNDPPVPLLQARPDLDPGLDAIVGQALAKDPDQRYASCRAFQIDLDRYLVERGLTVGARELAQLVEDLVGPPIPLQLTPPPVVRPNSNPALREAGEISVNGRQNDPRLGPIGGPPFPVTDVPQTALSPSDVRSLERSPRVLGPIAALIAVTGVGAGAFYLGTHSAPAPAPIIPAVAVAPLVATPPPPPAAVAAAPVAPPVVAPPPAPVPALVSPAPTPVAIAAVAAADPEVNRHAPDAKRHAHRPEAAAPVVHAPTPVVPAPAPVVPTPAVAKTGQLEFRVLPWANVEIDKRSFGQTPISAVTLDVGPHHVVLTNSDLHARKEIDVTIAPNEKAVVKSRMGDP